jgi:hypothetical protein
LSPEASPAATSSAAVSSESGRVAMGRQDTSRRLDARCTKP